MLLEKINITKIITDHIETLKNDNSNRHGLDDYFTFLIIPTVIASFLIFFHILLNSNAINITITSLAILVGLLFNVIILIFDIIKRDSKKQIKNKILQQLIANISFAILISIASILLILLTFFNNYFVNLIFHWYLYFSLTLFLFTVLMILKRIHILFKNEIVDIKDDSE